MAEHVWGWDGGMAVRGTGKGSGLFRIKVGATGSVRAPCKG